MRQEELMIGDILEYMGTIVKVYSIGARICVKECFGKNTYIVDFNNLLKGLELTTEILEKNGLKIDKYKGGFSPAWFFLFPACFKEDEHYDVEIEMKDEEIAWSINCGEYWIKRLNYVHELQHVLRLFGIDKEIEI